MVYETNRTSSTSGPSESAGYGLLDDVPPAYDSLDTSVSITAGSGYSGPSRAGGSSQPTQVRVPAWPASMNNYFVGPPNAEPMISIERVRSASDIAVKTTCGSIESWDKRLNDPAVLYDFLRTQALYPPTTRIRCVGTRKEVSQVKQTVIENGRSREVSAGQQYTVTDFDFTIDLTPVYSHQDNKNNVHLYTTGPDVPTFRGTHERTFGTAMEPNAYDVRSGQRPAGRTAGSKEVDIWRSWDKYRDERGLPPWSQMADNEEFCLSYSNQPRSGIFLGNLAQHLTGRRVQARSDEEALLGSNRREASESALKQWCEAYCADPGMLKSFTLTRRTWGWDTASLKQAIERAILSTGYQPTADGIKIGFVVSNDEKVTVRPDNWLVRMINHGFYFFLLCITLIYPFIWLWQRCHRLGGGPYQVAVATYGMKFYPPLPGTFPNETIEQAQLRLPAMYKLHPEVPRNPFLHRGPKGIHYLMGRREGPFFREWEERIRMAVRLRHHGELVDTRVDHDEDPPELDGY